MKSNVLEKTSPVSSVELVRLLKNARIVPRDVWVIGAGLIGQEYVKALKILGAASIHLCARSEASLAAFKGHKGLAVHAGGYERLQVVPAPEDVAIIALPVDVLAGALEHLLKRGFKKILCEKPVSLWSSDIDRLDKLAQSKGADVVCAYNRMAYPSLIEALSLLAKEGGATSCTYTFTEYVNRLKPEIYSADMQARWGASNTMHVFSMAHRLIGFPKSHTAFRQGGLPWHPSGSVFVGAGLSSDNVSFAYQADWGSTGRWSVELHTRQASYRLCPLEKLLRRTSPQGEWEEVPLSIFSPELKPGYLEQTAAMLSADIRRAVPVCMLAEAADLTRYVEDVFGYAPTREAR